MGLFKNNLAVLKIANIGFQNARTSDESLVAQRTLCIMVSIQKFGV
jgi:hypothetical protein